MKKVVFIFILNTIVFAQSSTTKFGNTYFNSDGSSTNKFGNTYFNSDGSSTTKFGNTYFNSDGSSTTKFGNTYFNSSVKRTPTYIFDDEKSSNDYMNTNLYQQFNIKSSNNSYNKQSTNFNPLPSSNTDLIENSNSKQSSSLFNRKY